MRLFCEAKASGLDNAKAARLAGYSVATAKTKGSELMARPEIRAEVTRLKKGEAEPGLRPIPLKAHYDSPLDFMLDVMNQPLMPPSLRFEAAKQALPYVNPRVDAKGKKDQRKDAAHKVAGESKFKPKRAPTSRGGVVADINQARKARA